MEVNGRSPYKQEGPSGAAAVLIAAADQIAMRADITSNVSNDANTSNDTTISLPVEPLEGTVTKAILDETCHQNSANIAEEFRSLSALFEKEGTLSSSKILSHQGKPIGFLSIDTNNKVLALYGTKKFTTLLGRIPEDNGNIFIFQGEKKISSSTSTLLMTSEEKWSQRFHLQNYRVPTSEEVEDFYDIHSKDTLMPCTDVSSARVDSFWLSKMMFCPLKWIPYLFKDNLTPYEALQIIQKLIQRDLKASVKEYAHHLLAFLRLACTQSLTNSTQASRMQLDWDIPKPDDIICRWAKSLSTTYFDLSKNQKNSRLSSIIPDYSSHLAPGPVYQPKASFTIPDTETNTQQQKPLPKLKRALPFPEDDDDDDKKKKKGKKYKTASTKTKNGKASPATSNMSLAERKKAAASICAINAGNGNKNDKAAALAAAILRGVTMRPSGKWQAQFYYAGKSRYIGVFQTREKAALAYEIVREKLKSDKPWEKGAMSMQEAEDQVSAARKAAFEGVDEKFRVNCTL